MSERGRALIREHWLRLREVLGRAREEGVGEVLLRAGNALLDRLPGRWEILYWHDTRTRAAQPSLSGLMFREAATPSEFAPLRPSVERSLGPSSMQTIEARIREGVELHGFWHGDELVASWFVVLGSRHPFMTVPLTPEDALGFDLRVRPDARGKGLATALIRATSAAAGRRGVCRLYASVGVRNLASQRAFARAGFFPLLRFRQRGTRVRFDVRRIR